MMLRLIEITTWALGGLVVGVLAGYGVAALTRCPRDDRANARPDVDGKRTISPDASIWSGKEKPA